MNFYITGQSGFVGKHVCACLAEKGHTIVDTLSAAEAVIHLAWAGLPNYDNPAHLDNIGWQTEFIESVYCAGIKNLTIAGSCLELTAPEMPYAQAKQQIHAYADAVGANLKWVRLYYLYGEGQREGCLLPRLRQAITSGAKTFRIAPLSRDFVPVATAARFLVEVAEKPYFRAVFNLTSDAPQTVKAFCRANIPPGCEIELVEDYPLQPWEK